MNHLTTLSTLVCVSASIIHAGQGSSSGSGSFSSLVSTTQSNVDSLNSRLKDWDASKGLAAALGIQDSYLPFYNSVTALQTASNTVTSSEIDTGALTKMVDSILELLSTFDQKHDAFKTAGVATISSRDISDLIEPATDIVNGVLKALNKDCPALQALSVPVKNLGDAFTSSEKTYGIQAKSFPAVQQCSTGKVINGESLESTGTGSASSKADDVQLHENFSGVSGYQQVAAIPDSTASPAMDQPVNSRAIQPTGHYSIPDDNRQTDSPRPPQVASNATTIGSHGARVAGPAFINEQADDSPLASNKTDVPMNSTQRLPFTSTSTNKTGPPLSTFDPNQLDQNSIPLANGALSSGTGISFLALGALMLL